MPCHEYSNLIVADTISSLKSPGSSSGAEMVAAVVDTGKIYVVSNGAWQETAGGPAGEQGVKGDKGDKGDTGATGTQCYTLSIMAANIATMTDAQTIYFGSLAGLAPGTTAALARMYIPQNGTIKAAYIYANAATAGTNEAWVLRIRLNNTSDTQIASLSANTVTRLWSNAALSIPVVAGDYVEIKSVNPTWATNPANVRFGGVLYIEV